MRELQWEFTEINLVLEAGSVPLCPSVHLLSQINKTDNYSYVFQTSLKAIPFVIGGIIESTNEKLQDTAKSTGSSTTAFRHSSLIRFQGLEMFYPCFIRRP